MFNDGNGHTLKARHSLDSLVKQYSEHFAKSPIIIKSAQLLIMDIPQLSVGCVKDIEINILNLEIQNSGFNISFPIIEQRNLGIETENKNNIHKVEG